MATVEVKIIIVILLMAAFTGGASVVRGGPAERRYFGWPVLIVCLVTASLLASLVIEGGR